MREAAPLREDVAKRLEGAFNDAAMSALPQRSFTPEEYLELEGKAEYKSQYVDGEIFAMAGAEPWHNDVVSSLVLALGTRFRGRPCKIYTGEMRLRVEGSNLYAYPDVMAVGGQRLFDASQKPRSPQGFHRPPRHRLASPASEPCGKIPRK